MVSPSPPGRSKRKSTGDTVQKNIKRIRNAIQPSGTGSSPTPSMSAGSASSTPGRRSPVSHVQGIIASSHNQSINSPTAGSSSQFATVVKDVGHGTVQKIRTATSGLESALRGLRIGAGAIPPLKPVVDELVGCLDVVRGATKSAEEYDQLTLELNNLARELGEYLSELSPEDARSNPSCEHIALLIEAEVAHIKRQQDRSRISRALSSNEDAHDVIQCYHRVEGLFRRLQTNIGIQILKTTNDKRQYVETLLRSMSPVDDARYNSGYSTTVERRCCTEETREQVQEDLRKWVKDPNGAKVYWMNGMAGIGKTTVAYSLCEWLKTNKRLGASFFCSRVSASCRNVKSIVPTIAYQLARYSPVFRVALVKVLEEDPEASVLNVSGQFEKLLKEPMKEVNDTMPEGVVVVIDALDECEDDYDIQLVLKVLLGLVADMSLKFFVTSRPEPVIRDNMLSQDGYLPSVLHLHDIEQSVVEDDIKKYLTEELRLMTPPPAAEQIGRLAKLAGNLFIYAATVKRYILPGRSAAHSTGRLKKVLEDSSKIYYTEGSNKRFQQLDELYTTVIATALDAPELEPDELRATQLVLWTVVCAKEPMNIPTLSLFLSLTEDQVSSGLQPLLSVLHLSEANKLVSTFHASFSDYMLDPSRSQQFCIDQVSQGELLLHACFETMRNQLRFNLCNLRSSFVLDKNVADLKHQIETNISPGLFYACRYWGAHLGASSGGDHASPCKEVEIFLNNRFLFWMEVLNLKQCVWKGVSILSRVELWLPRLGASPGIVQLAADARDFVARFAAGSCTRSTPHIYISSLPFCASSSLIHKRYRGRTQGLMDVGGTAILQRDRLAQATWETHSGINSVGCSPDGTLIVAGSQNNTLQVRDASTGDLVSGPLEGHTDWVSAVAFSADGAYVASGSHDGTVRLWEVLTGCALVSSLRGHTDWVSSVVFSPNNTHLFSGAYDGTIREWDVHTSVDSTRLFLGHTDHVLSLAVSPDGGRIASGSADRSIRVWDALTGETVAGPFQGHTGMVASVEFSPDGRSLASGAYDHTIQVWDPDTGIVIAGPFRGHTDAVTCVAFSPDGACIASVSGDQTARVWNARTGDAIAGPFQGYTDSVNSVVFSIDGRRIISGSDDKTIRIWEVPADSGSVLEPRNAYVKPQPTYRVPLVPSLMSSLTPSIPQEYNPAIRVWDSQTGELDHGPREVDNTLAGSVAFSSDGRFIVSGSYDMTVGAWNKREGDTLLEMLDGHAELVSSVEFSPDGDLAVSGSYDRSIRVWRVYGYNHIDFAHGPFIGHTLSVMAVTFSPDVTRIASGSHDRTIRVWSVDTGEIVAGPFHGHERSVNSVAFSPDGTCIVSGSSDCTVRVWDSHTGDTTVGSLQGHEAMVNSVAFSPDGIHVASGSSDRTIRVWDTRAGNASIEPFRGHHERINSIKFSPDGTRIVSGSDDQTIRVWDVFSGNVVAGPFSAQGAVYSVGFSPHSNHVVSSSSGQIIQIWDLLSDDSDFQLNDDGWFTRGDELLLWVPPDFRAHVPHPRNTLLIGPLGSVFINYRELLVGERWSECFVPSSGQQREK